MNKSLNSITFQEFMDMDYKMPEKPFTGVVIVPMQEPHDSGYRTMKFVLTHGDEIIGVVGGECDVIHLDGIGGYGKLHGDELKTAIVSNMTKRTDWSIDCLWQSHCIRLFSSYACEIDDFIGSDFCIYATKPYRR